MDTIVVGLDGSKTAQAAARWAAEHAKQTGGHVIAVHAIARTELWTLSAFQVNVDKLRDELRDLLAGPWVAPMQKLGVSYSTHLVRGDPATELLRVAKRRNATMLVVGTKGHSTLADMVVGGTVHKIINRSPIPVVLVPSPMK